MVSQQLPPRPDLVLRLGFAGNRVLPEDRQPLEATIDAVLQIVVDRLAELAPGGTKPAGFAQFYSTEKPCLRAVTGLAEGADAVAAAAVRKLSNEHVRYELAAVLPFDTKTFRDSREPDFQATFDDLLESCAWVLELDGRYGEGDENRPYRSRAYRAQTTLLLRHCDILVAMADPKKEAKAGGTQEAIQAALEFGLPVILIETGGGSIKLFEPGGAEAGQIAVPAQDFADCESAAWRQQLRGWITSIVADPDVALERPHAGETGGTHGPPKENPGLKLLEEFFDGRRVPKRKRDGRQRATFRERLWKQFEQKFQRLPAGPSDSALEPYAAYRKRATSLSYHYVGLYRGAFVLNYGFAVLAVLLATLSLIVLANPQPPIWLLLGLAAPKLAIVIIILLNTHQANHETFNDKAIDYRYLAERLRLQYYLPRLGSFQPPAAAMTRYASRVVRQSAVDWLFEAIVRHVSPARLAAPAADTGKGTAVRTSKLDPEAVLRDVQTALIGGQIAYHERNADTMHRMHHWMDTRVAWLNWLVIGAVSIDLLILLLEAWHVLPENLSRAAHGAAPWLVFLAAVLPAAVASLNGIRFQSESRRLADRSSVMVKILRARAAQAEEIHCGIKSARENSSADPGSWTPEVLRLTEACAQDLVEEVTDWSVLYAKDIFEP